jgi:hypothetical protein
MLRVQEVLYPLPFLLCLDHYHSYASVYASDYLAYTGERLNIYLRRKVVCVFICFVYHVEISRTTARLVTLLVLLENPQGLGVAPSWFHNVLT